MALYQQFKKTNPQEEQKAAENRSKFSGTNFSLFREGITKYRFEEGANLLRLLPQHVSSPYPNSIDVSVLSFWEDSLPIRGELRIMDDQGWLLTRMYKLLRAHSEFKYALWSKENENGISFNPRSRVVFLGFNINDPEKKVCPIILPATPPYPAKDGKARMPQAGSRIRQFVTETDIHGNLLHGDIFDVVEGRVIKVDVTNAGTMRVKYEPSPNSVYPLSDASFECVLEQILPWDQVLNETSMETLVNAMKSYLTASGDSRIFDYLDSQIHFDRVIAQAENRAVENESSTRVEKPAPAQTLTAAVPLPEEDDEDTAPPLDDPELEKVASAAVSKLDGLRKELRNRK